MKLVLAVLALCLATPALAQQRCFPSGLIEEGLKTSKYKEQLIGAGVVEGGKRITVHANPATQTFSILYSDGQKTCFVAVGKGWSSVAPQPVISGKDM